MTKRLKDWNKRLLAVVEDARSREFQYGDLDCGQLAREAEIALTGETSFPEWEPGAYSDPEGWRSILAGLGYDDIPQLLTARLYAYPTTLQARTGDFGVVETPEGDAIVVNFGRRWAGAFQSGVRFVGHSVVHSAWRVGDDFTGD